MNIPNSMSMNTTLDPGKRHLDRTYPFREPMSDDRTVATTPSTRLLASLGRKDTNASVKLAQFTGLGRFQAVSSVMLAGILSAVTNMRYPGMRKNSVANASNK